MSLFERIKRDSLRSPDSRGPIAYLLRKINPRKTIPDRHIGIFLTTQCNLNCFSCSALGMSPRPKVEHTSLEDIELFLEQMAYLHPYSYVTLIGGEPTAYPWLREACELVRKYGFKPTMITNGYKIVPPEWFDYIIIDLHGDTNQQQIKKWKELLEESNITWGMYKKQYHRDVRVALEDNITKGARCSNWLKPLTLWKNIVYPCCNLMCVEWWNNDHSSTLALKKAGWTTDNLNLSWTIKNWRRTLPPSVYRMCTIKCWKDADKARWGKV